MLTKPYLNLIVLFVAMCAVAEMVASSPAAKPLVSAPAPVTIQMRNVRLRASSNVVLNVEWLQGHLISTVKGHTPVFDNPRSFWVDITDAEIAVGAPSLTALVNTAFDYSGSPLSNLSIALKENHLEQHGTLHKILPIPFTVKADVAATRDGRMLLRPSKISGARLPLGSLMSTLGLELDSLIKSKPDRGIVVQDNDLILDPGRIVPGLQMRGKLSRAAIRGDALVQTFGRGTASKPSASSAGNYIWFLGGVITFGRLTMKDADLQLIDADASDPFDFSPAGYNDQLVAGYSRNTPSGALRTYMPDYSDIRHLDHGKLAAPLATR